MQLSYYFKMPGRQIAIGFIVLGFLISCGQSDPAIVTKQADKTEGKTERQILIEELKRLRSVFASGDKESVADLFPFPVSNEKMSIYVDDSTYNAEYEKNGNKATRAMFISAYDEIADALQISQMNQLFKKLKIEHLLQKDTIEHQAIIKTEPCYYSYEVKIEKDLVTLTLETNSNKEFVGKTVSEEELVEHSSEFCEHVLWWVFQFDGKRLRLKEILSAG